MIASIKSAVTFLLIALFISCGSSKTSSAGYEVNTEVNSKYRESMNAYDGNLNDTEYRKIIDNLETALQAKIPKDKAVLVNFNQKAPNCITFGRSRSIAKKVTENRIRISSDITTQNNAIDFFVYTEDAFHKEIFEKKPEFMLDSGFFHENVFTEQEHCAAFLIIKPNGDFYKYYGEDYYSHVKGFLEQD